MIRITRMHRVARLARLSRLTRLMRLTRIARLIKLCAFFKKNSFFRVVQQTRGVRVLNFVIGLFFIAHLLACGWYLVAALHSIPEHTWVYRRPVGAGDSFVVERGGGEQWLHSMYFILTVFTTVGFGDIGPMTSLEMIYVIIVMLIGAVVQSIIVSEMISIVTCVDEATSAIAHRKELVAAFCKYTAIGDATERKMTKCIEYARDANPRYDRSTVQSMLLSGVFPQDLVESLPLGAFSGKLANNLLFDKCSDTRMSLLVAVHVVQKIYAQAEIVYQYREHPCNCFLVATGTFAHIAFPSAEGGVTGNDTEVDVGLGGTRSIGNRERTESSESGLSSPEKRKSPSMPIIGPRSPASESGLGVRRQKSAESNRPQYPYQLFSFRGFFGENEFLFPSVRRSAVRCESRNGILLALPRRAFNVLVGEFPRFLEQLKHISQRREARRLLNLENFTRGMGVHRFSATRIQRQVRMRQAQRKVARVQTSVLKVAKFQSIGKESKNTVMADECSDQCKEHTTVVPTNAGASEDPAADPEVADAVRQQESPARPDSPTRHASQRSSSAAQFLALSAGDETLHEPFAMDGNSGGGCSCNAPALLKQIRSLQAGQERQRNEMHNSIDSLQTAMDRKIESIQSTQERILHSLSDVMHAIHTITLDTSQGPH